MFIVIPFWVFIAANKNKYGTKIKTVDIELNLKQFNLTGSGQVYK